MRARGTHGTKHFNCDTVHLNHTAHQTSPALLMLQLQRLLLIHSSLRLGGQQVLETTLDLLAGSSVQSNIDVLDESVHLRRNTCQNWQRDLTRRARNQARANSAKSNVPAPLPPHPRCACAPCGHARGMARCGYPCATQTCSGWSLCGHQQSSSPWQRKP